MSNKPLISVIIRTYNNRNGFLAEAIESVLNQTYPNIQIVVVEDGSNYASPLIDKYRSNYNANIKYLSIQKAGRCIAGNCGLASSDGDLINFLDDDDQLFKDHLELLFNAIDTNGVKAAYSNAYEVSTELITQNPLKYKEHNKQVVYNLDFSRVLIWKQNFLPIQSVLFDKSLFLEYGGFEEDLDALEDWHLWMKYSLKNEFKHVQSITSFYRVPYKSDVATKRIELMDGYKKKIRLKQKEMNYNTNIAEILDMIAECNEKTLVFKLSKDDFKEFAKNNIIVMRFYSLLRRVFYRIFM